MCDRKNLLNNVDLPIGKFKFDLFPSDAAIVLIAKRGSGKSFIVREIMEHYKDIPVGAVICPSERDTPSYSSFFPETYIHFKYEPKILERIFKRQIIISDKFKKHKDKGEKIDPRCILVMDDCMASKKVWANDQLVKEVLMNGRHKKITYILTMQYPLGVHPELRCNFDIIFILANDEIKSMKLLHENYAGIFESLDSFRAVLSKLTRDYGAMVLVKRGPNADFYDKVKWYRANSRENEENNNDIQIGCKQFIKFHNKNYNPEWKNDNLLELDEHFLRKEKKDYNALLKNAKKGNISLNINPED